MSNNRKSDGVRVSGNYPEHTRNGTHTHIFVDSISQSLKSGRKEVSRMKKNAKKLLAVLLSIVTVFCALPQKACAISAAYTENYSIADAVAYAKTYGETANPKYPYYSNHDGGDCTNFVSQCLLAGGVTKDWEWTPDDNPVTRLTKAYECFINTPRLMNYLLSKGYTADCFFSPEGSGTVPCGFAPGAGDIVMLDYSGDGAPDHAVFCIGYGSDGICHYAAHSSNTSDTSFARLFDAYSDYNARYYVIHMSGVPIGAKDVTAMYVGKRIAIYSEESKKYVSCNTSCDTKTVDAVADRSTVSSWEVFSVEAGPNGTAGFRSYNGNYLSSCLNVSNTPVRAAYGRNYAVPQNWESYRIYERYGVLYIQSQANGRWVQTYMSDSAYPLRARGMTPSTWEQFRITIL